MKFRVSDLSTAGLTLNEELSLESLNARMSEGRENDILFTSPPRASIHVSPTASGALLKGNISSQYKQACSLCLEQKSRTVDIETMLVLKERPLDETADQYEDDVGVVYYENDHAELDDVLEEALILSLDIFWHPEFEEGRCTECKKGKSDLGLAEPNTGTTLGVLLKKAGVSKKI